MRKPAGEKTIEQLIAAGWTVSHTATTDTYRFAGGISTMRPKNGRDYIRVHHGKCVGPHRLQITTVLYRAAKEA